MYFDSQVLQYVLTIQFKTIDVNYIHGSGHNIDEAWHNYSKIKENTVITVFVCFSLS